MENCCFEIKCTKCGACAKIGSDKLKTPYTEGDIYIYAYVNQLDTSSKKQKIFVKCLKCGNDFEITDRVMFYR